MVDVNPTGIYGTWYNQLGSQMELTGSGSLVSGKYASAVGQAAYLYTLNGMVNAYYNLPYSGVALGWTVAWVNDYMQTPSATSWQGQYQVLDDGSDQITALWLLVTETIPGSNWASTQVGKDVFKRTPPSEKEIEAARRTGGAPHPIH